MTFKIKHGSSPRSTNYVSGLADCEWGSYIKGGSSRQALTFRTEAEARGWLLEAIAMSNATTHAFNRSGELEEGDQPLPDTGMWAFNIASK